MNYIYSKSRDGQWTEKRLLTYPGKTVSAGCSTIDTERYAGQGLLLAHDDITTPENTQKTKMIQTLFILRRTLKK
jgi:hypothetical protein